MIRLPFAEALGMVETGEIADAKTILLLQYAALKGLLRLERLDAGFELEEAGRRCVAHLVDEERILQQEPQIGVARTQRWADAERGRKTSRPAAGWREPAKQRSRPAGPGSGL